MVQQFSRIAVLALVLAGFLVSGCEKDDPASPSNHAPTIHRIDSRIEGSGLQASYHLRCLAEDEDGDELSYAWQASSGHFPMGTDADSTVWEPPATEGSFCVTVSVSDGVVSTDSTLAFDLANTPPVIDSVTVSSEGAGVEKHYLLQAVAHDPDGDALAFTWSTVKGDFLTDTTAATVTWQPPPHGGTWHVTLTVSDGMDDQVQPVEVAVSLETWILPTQDIASQLGTWDHEVRGGYAIPGGFRVFSKGTATEAIDVYEDGSFDTGQGYTDALCYDRFTVSHDRVFFSASTSHQMGTQGIGWLDVQDQATRDELYRVEMDGLYEDATNTWFTGVAPFADGSCVVMGSDYLEDNGMAVWSHNFLVRYTSTGERDWVNEGSYAHHICSLADGSVAIDSMGTLIKVIDAMGDTVATYDPELEQIDGLFARGNMVYCLSRYFDSNILVAIDAQSGARQVILNGGDEGKTINGIAFAANGDLLLYGTLTADDTAFYERRQADGTLVWNRILQDVVSPVIDTSSSIRVQQFSEAPSGKLLLFFGNHYIMLTNEDGTL